MNKKPKYRVVERPCSEYGSRCRVFVIERLTWLGFYWDTDDYYFDKSHADKYCRRLNKEYERKRIA